MYLKYLYYATSSISFKVLLESKCFDLNADLCHEHQVKTIRYDPLKLAREVAVSRIIFNLVLFFLINEHHDMFIIVTFGDDDE